MIYICDRGDLSRIQIRWPLTYCGRRNSFHSPLYTLARSGPLPWSSPLVDKPDGPTYYVNQIRCGILTNTSFAGRYFGMWTSKSSYVNFRTPSSSVHIWRMKIDRSSICILHQLLCISTRSSLLGHCYVTLSAYLNNRKGSRWVNTWITSSLVVCSW